MDNTVLVIADTRESMKAHQELFHWSDELYRVSQKLPVEILDGLDRKIERVHIVGSWQYILQIATGSKELTPGDLSLLMKKLGLTDEEVKPFLNAPLNDLFYTLYYGKRFDVLRRLCHYIKKSIQEEFSGIMVDCHIVVPDRAQIVASSL